MASPSPFTAVTTSPTLDAPAASSRYRSAGRSGAVKAMWKTIGSVAA
jgi:hypothetical protein